MSARTEAEDSRLDWALGERLGGETPPDLAATIVARHLDGERGPQLPSAAPPSRRWLAAALLLLGIGVVFAVAMRRARPDPELPTQQPERPPAPTVSTVAEVQALPASTRAVIVRNAGDEVATALLRLRDLEDLEWHASDREVFGMMLKTADAGAAPILFHPGFRALCSLGKLRRLVLSGTAYVRTAGPGTFELLDDLQKLPLLQELALRFFDVPDDDFADCFAVLPKLASLRRLDLSFDHGFGARGIDALLQCQNLESLSVRGCQQLTPEQLARLGSLPKLRELDASLIDGINWRNSSADEQDPLISARLFGARQTARKAVTGVTDEALAGIARARELRRLELGGSRLTSVAPLAELPMLEHLDLGGIPLGDGIAGDLPSGLTSLIVCSDRLTDAFCGALRRLPKLEHLDASACYGIRDAGIAALAALPSLRRLELRQMYGATAACIEPLLQARQLVELDLRHCAFVTAEHVAALRRALPGLRALHTDVTD